MSEEQVSTIRYLTPVSLDKVYVPSVALTAWLARTVTPQTPTYLLLQMPKAGTRLVDQDNQPVQWQPQVIMQKLRATYGQTGVAFSVLSEKQGRMLICASLSRETTESQSPSTLPSGSESTSSAQSPCTRQGCQFPGPETQV